MADPIRCLLAIAAVLSFAAGCAERSAPPAPLRTGGAARPALTRNEAETRSVTVQPGDTIHAIAQRSGVTMRALVDANGLRPPYVLQAGRSLRLPGQAPAPGATGRTGAEARTGRPADPGPRPEAAIIALGEPRGAGDPGIVAPPPPAPPAAMDEGNLPGAAVPAGTTRGAAQTPPPPAPATIMAETARSERVAPTPPLAPNAFAWPLRGRIISGFGSKPGGLQNDGINIAAARGTAVRATADGTVVYAGNELKGFGNLLLLRHEDGWMSAYAHLDAILVEKGDRIRRGQTVARVGQTGNVASPQLHFELRRHGRIIDPMTVLNEAAANLDE